MFGDIAEGGSDKTCILYFEGEVCMLCIISASQLQLHLPFSPWANSEGCAQQSHFCDVFHIQEVPFLRAAM